MKKCTKCHTLKPKTGFYRDSDQSSGLRPDCILCCAKRRKLGYYNLKQDTEKFKKITRESHLKTTYGIDSAYYNRLFLKQLGKCKICQIHQNELQKALCVDHNHKTGKIRGLLCDPCNRGLGAFRDSSANLTRAIEYINEI